MIKRSREPFLYVAGRDEERKEEVLNGAPQSSPQCLQEYHYGASAFRPGVAGNDAGWQGALLGGVSVLR